MKKTKKALFPFLAGALLLTMGLTACNNAKSDKPASSGDTSEVEETKINVTAAGNKTTLKVGETVQLSADVEGVEWSTRAGTVVSVDKNGLVTALGVGSGKVTAKKDGYANGSITITVEKAPDREPNYSLRLEEAEHFDPDDFWGMDLSQYGMGVMGPGDSPVEDNGGKTDDGTSLGWLQQGCKETLTFTSNKAVKVELGVTMAYNAEMSLDGVLSVKFNGKEISMAGRTVPAPEDGESYYEFNTVSFGQVDLIAGNNVLEIEMLAQGPNMDKVVIFTSETLQIATVPAQTKPKIEVVEAEIEIQVDEEKQIQVKDNLAGVAYKSADEAIATVSTAGVVKGIKAGKTTVEVTKDGYKKATVSVTVKAKPVAGQVILEAEAGKELREEVRNVQRGVHRAVEALLEHVHELVIGRGVAAVRDDAADVLRQIRPEGHQHRRAAHADADERDVVLRPEAVGEVERPVPDVEALLDAVGDVLTVALTVGALADREDVPAQRVIKAIGQAEVDKRAAAVTVHEQERPLRVRGGEEPADQPQAIVAGDLYALRVLLPEPLRAGGDILREGAERLALRRVRLDRHPDAGKEKRGITESEEKKHEDQKNQQYDRHEAASFAES